MSGCLVLGIFLVNNGQSAVDEAPVEGQCLCLSAIVKMAEGGSDKGSFICDAHVSFAGDGISKERHPLVGVNVEKLAPIPLGCALGCGKSSNEPFQCWYVKQTDLIKSAILTDGVAEAEGSGEVIILGYAITALSACGLSFITAGITVWVRSRLKQRTNAPASPIDTLTVPHSHHSRARHGTSNGGLGMSGPSGNTTMGGRPRSIRPLDQVGKARAPSPTPPRPTEAPTGIVGPHQGRPPHIQGASHPGRALSPTPNSGAGRGPGLTWSGSNPPLPMPPPWSEPRTAVELEEEEAISGNTMSSRASQADLLA